MPSTRTTDYLHLPVFDPNDKPAWQVDFNGAMETIDNAVEEADVNANEAIVKASTAESAVNEIRNNYVPKSRTINNVSLTNNVFLNADSIPFDNEGTSSTAENVQDAVAEAVTGNVKYVNSNDLSTKGKSQPNDNASGVYLSNDGKVNISAAAGGSIDFRFENYTGAPTARIKETESGVLKVDGELYTDRGRTLGEIAGNVGGTYGDFKVRCTTAGTALIVLVYHGGNTDEIYIARMTGQGTTYLSKLRGSTVFSETHSGGLFTISASGISIVTVIPLTGVWQREE